MQEIVLINNDNLLISCQKLDIIKQLIKSFDNKIKTVGNEHKMKKSS